MSDQKLKLIHTILSNEGFYEMLSEFSSAQILAYLGKYEDTKFTIGIIAIFVAKYANDVAEEILKYE